jgi:glutamine synthetase
MKEIWPSQSFKGEAYEEEDSEHEIPRSMYDALDLFSEAPEIREILGNEFARVYETVKRTEYAEFLQVISPWEREHLLLNV